jgi:hypothetical protein
MILYWWQVLDRTKARPSPAMHIVGPALTAVGVDTTNLTSATISIYKPRKSLHHLIAESSCENFCINTPLIVHFDGKLLPGTDGVDAAPLSIVVSR